MPKRSRHSASDRPKPPYSPTRPNSKPAARPNTSWEKSAGWYDRIIGAQGSELYQNVVLPGALKLLNPREGEVHLDLGCGQGVFSRAVAEAGAEVTGVDLSPTLIEKARGHRGPADIRYLHRDAAKLGHLGPFHSLSAILSIQNMPHLAAVCRSAAEVLRPGGRMLWVLNHPCFRIPRQTSWEWDAENGVQYRRIDAYSSQKEIPILMHPGQQKSESTVSFHHSLTGLMLPAFQAGLQLAGLEEWHSHKQSEPGPRAKAENHARNEFPLFLALLWRKP